MTKQSKIRENLIELLEQTDFNKETPSQLTDAILWVLNEDKVVIKVERELLQSEIKPVWMRDIVNETLRKLKEAGYVATEPLIEEK